MKCQHETYHDDMYPEFAPEPIVVDCDATATFHYTVSEMWFDEGGMPNPAIRHTVHEWVCATHAYDFDPMGHHRLMADAKLLSLTISGGTN